MAVLLDKQLKAEREERSKSRCATSSSKAGVLARLPPPSPASVAQKSATLGVTAQTHRSKVLDLSFQGIVGFEKLRKTAFMRPDEVLPWTWWDAVEPRRWSGTKGR